MINQTAQSVCEIGVPETHVLKGSNGSRTLVGFAIVLEQRSEHRDLNERRLLGNASTAVNGRKGRLESYVDAPCRQEF